MNLYKKHIELYFSKSGDFAQLGKQNLDDKKSKNETINILVEEIHNVLILLIDKNKYKY